MKGEILRRKRSNSLPIVELFKRGEKRKERQEEKKEEEVEAFNKNTRMVKSSMRKEEKEDIVKEIRARFKEIMREMKK